MKVKRFLLVSMSLLLLVILSSCSVSDEKNVDDPADKNDENSIDENSKPDDSTNEDADKENDVVTDESVNDESSDMPDESQVSDKDNETDDDNGTSGEGAYQKCDPGTAGSCPEGMNCVKGYDNAKYGQCLKSCSENIDCPPPPDAGQQVACHATEKVCLILCGAYEGECPEWLECFGQEMCLPPSSVVATKGPGEKCSGKDECIGESDCIEGSSGIAYCYPLCDPAVANDCANKAPGFQAQCTDAGGFAFCMFTCQGVPCPGELECVAGVFCQG